MLRCSHLAGLPHVVEYITEDALLSIDLALPPPPSRTFAPSGDRAAAGGAATASAAVPWPQQQPADNAAAGAPLASRSRPQGAARRTQRLPAGTDAALPSDGAASPAQERVAAGSAPVISRCICFECACVRNLDSPGSNSCWCHVASVAVASDMWSAHPREVIRQSRALAPRILDQYARDTCHQTRSHRRTGSRGS